MTREDALNRDGRQEGAARWINSIDFVMHLSSTR